LNLPNSSSAFLRFYISIEVNEIPLCLILSFYRKCLGIPSKVISDNKVVKVSISRGDTTRESNINMDFLKYISSTPRYTTWVIITSFSVYIALVYLVPIIISKVYTSRYSNYSSDIYKTNMAKSLVLYFEGSSSIVIPG